MIGIRLFIGLTLALCVLGSAAQAGGPPGIALHSSACTNNGMLIVTIDVSGQSMTIVGGQFFLQYNNSVLQFVSAEPGDAPFTNEIFESVNTVAGTIDYAVGIQINGVGTMNNSTMAVLKFNTLQQVCSTANLVSFRANFPPTRLTDSQGDSITPRASNLGSLTIDSTPPTLNLPPDVTVECDPSDPTAQPGVFLGTANGGVHIVYNAGQPEVPAQQAYLKTKFVQSGNNNGAHLTFDNSLLSPYNFPGVTWATLFGQVSPSQFGLDMVLPAPTWDGMTPIPLLTAVDNTNGNCGGAIPAGNVVWAINDYNATGGPTNPSNCVVNSLFRSAGLAPNAVIITKNIVTHTGTVYVANIGGILQTDNFIHWYNPMTPNSPVSNFLLNGRFYFNASLTYDSFGDPGNDGDFYAGTITLSANSPYTGANAVGVANVNDNCTLQPLVTFSDVTTNGTCAQEKFIARTWTATDSCGNSSSGVQHIHVVDTTPPVFTFVPANIGPINADAGGCTAVVNVGQALAQDVCDANPSVVGTRSDNLALNAPYPTGVTTITWKATDACNNMSMAIQTVTVNPVNTMMTDIHLAGTYAGTDFMRCIRFELRHCSGGGVTVVDQNIHFVNGQANGVAIEVPCGSYNCITARDRKHTLRRTDSSFHSMGVVYVANFTGGDALVGGNLNDDFFIDILDFGIFVGQFSSAPGADTTCGYVGNNADIDGDSVVFTGDFTFIQQNFLQTSEANCCGAGNMPVFVDAGEAASARRNPPSDKPVTRISVRELQKRGLEDLIKADLNHDGWLDEKDVTAFMTGATP